MIPNTSTNGPSLPRSLMSVYFTHSGYADYHVEKMYRTIEKHTTNCKNFIPLVGGDFNVELELGSRTECTSVGKHTLNGGNKRVDWMKHWLMLQGFTALNTMYRKNPGKQTTYRSPKGNEKQIDYILTKTKHLKYNRDAEADDMIHMGSDHRCVMATCTITTPERDGHRKTTERRARHDKNTKKGIKPRKTLETRSLSLKKDTKRSLRKFKNSRSRKQRTESSRRKTAETKKAAAQAESENAEAEAKEAEGEFSEIMVRNDVESGRRDR